MALLNNGSLITWGNMRDGLLKVPQDIANSGAMSTPKCPSALVVEFWLK
jgi:hypothetical protein